MSTNGKSILLVIFFYNYTPYIIENFKWMAPAHFKILYLFTQYAQVLFNLITVKK